MFDNPTQKVVNVQGTEYILNLIPATRGIKVLKQLISIVGPAYATYQASSDIGGAIAVVLENLDKHDVETLVQNLMTTVFKGSMAIDFGKEFAGRYDLLFALTKEVVEYNFGSVFSMLGSEGAPTA